MRKTIICLTALAFLCCLSAPALADGVTLSYANFFPPTHVQSQLAEAWCAEVEKRTNGAVKIDYYPGGTLTKAPAVYDGVVEGLSDVGLSVLAYSRGRFPVMAAVDLPMGYTTGVQATKVANGVYAKFHPAELDDTKVMYFHAHGPGLLHTKGVEVRKLEDMQGLKLRATGNSAKVVKALGATPVAQSMSDAYQAIQKGVVQGGMYPIETNKGWKMADVVDHCTGTYSVAYTTTFFVVMNKAKWESLPADVQSTIEAINAEWIPKHGQAWDDSDISGGAYLKTKGGDFIALSDEEAARWKAAAAPIIDDYVAEATGKGLPGKDVVDYIRASLNAN